MGTRYATAEVIEDTITRLASPAQLARYADLTSQGWKRGEIRFSTDNTKIAIGMTRSSTSGYSGGYLCSDGKLALPVKGRTGVTLNLRDMTRGF